MNKFIIATAITLLSTQVFASLSVNDGLSSCRFSKSEAAINYARALEGSTKAAALLKRGDLAQVESCSTAMTEALAKGVSYNELAKTVNTNFNHLENGMEITVELRGKDFYEVKGDNLTGTKSTIEGDFDMVISVEGSRNEITQGIPAREFLNKMKLNIVSKKAVQIIFEEYDVDTVVPAIVKKSLFGKIKQISIKAEDLERAIAPVLSAQGLDLAEDFKLNTEKGSFTMDYSVSAMDCGVNQLDEFECRSSFIFQLSAQF
ncbi:hypothetical protein M902_0982 [Bacteriovorax sp. BAL6_X]|uniref:hypothetical protein n=1 Tax=Bacteriovorax sp. BAL6_X TaxID=1201290 RepID=UPI0003867CE7|nr:hypothetical protein [Bacteriovorax sp. BAL6_X]EPZ49800.1 hypothetical protein M902_0982 [Bacteriovorax sp. BAL6_X]